MFQARESYMKLTKSFEPVPEVEHLQTEEYDLGTHSVCITELSTDEIAKHNNWIGANRVSIIFDGSVTHQRYKLTNGLL